MERDQGYRIKFSKHAREKFEVLKRYGFEISEGEVIGTIRSPARVDKRGTQHLAIRAIDEQYALRVVYEERKGHLLVITFYPVRRERYGV
jgi:hypothetical protein